MDMTVSRAKATLELQRIDPVAFNHFLDKIEAEYSLMQAFLNNDETCSPRGTVEQSEARFKVNGRLIEIERFAETYNRLYDMMTS